MNNINSVEISIIIPVYNLAKYLENCLDSILNQTFKNFEVICINDGSVDNSLEILEQYAKKDKRFKIFSQENSGAAIARNKGLSLAQGKYIYFLDGDDYINHELLSKLYNQIEKENADICICNFNHYSEGLKKLMYYKWTFKSELCPSYNFSSSNIPDKILQICVPNLFIKLFKKSFIDKYNLSFQDIKTCNDVYFERTALVLAQSITYVDEVLATYRTNRQDSISSKRAKHLNALFIAYDKIKLTLKKYNKFNLVKKSYYQSLTNNAIYEYNCADEQNKQKFVDKLYKKLPIQYFQNFLKSVKIDNSNNYDKIFFTYKIEGKKKTIIRYENILKNIFSIRNSIDRKSKIIKILGIKIKFKRRKQFFKDNVIHIVFSSSDDYILGLYSTLKSLISHSSKENFYYINILYSNISPCNKKIINDLAKANISINFIDINNKIKTEAFYTSNHITQEAYYRLYIPEIFNDCEKILYIDCDLIVRKDLAFLYNENIDNYILAAVRNPPNKYYKQYRREVLNVDENDYFNSGVILINTKNYINNNIKQKCIELLETTLKTPKCWDQDLLNVTCKNQVKYLDERWNFQWTPYIAPCAFSKSIFKNFKKRAFKSFIFHYTTDKKPWNYLCIYSFIWWVNIFLSPPPRYKGFV